MCEKCEAMEDTFREVIDFMWGTLLADRYGSFHRDLHPGDIVYVVRRGGAVRSIQTEGTVLPAVGWLGRC